MEREVAFLTERQSAERLANLITLSYEPMLAWQLDGPIEFWNSGAERLYGYTIDEAIGRSSHDLLQTKFPTEFAEWQSQLRATKYWSGELRHICKDGREVTVDSRMQLLADDTVLEANRDITERKQNEVTFYDNELRWRSLASIVECSDDAIVGKNLDGIITSWNKGAERIFGYTAEEAIGQPITIVIPADRQNEEREILTRLRRGERIDHFETVRQRRHGSLITVSLTVSPVKNAAGKIIGASKIARDITEQKRSQEQITALAREAEHRTKNVLASVQAAVNLSRADTAEGFKHSIEGRIQALANVHSLFIESRWIGAELSAIAAQELAPYTAKERLRIEGPPVLLETNAAQAIAVALHELATNAAKYGSLSGSGGGVELKWTHGADQQLIMRWTETGGPAVQVPTRRGFGSQVIGRMIGQLKGNARFNWRPEGLICEIALRT